jgi:hypothetical protein
MFTLTMRFTLPENTDWSKIPAKAFAYDPDTREYGGNYLWERREQIDAFLKSDIVAGARQKFGEPTYRVHRVAAYLDRGKVYVPAATAKA